MRLKAREEDGLHSHPNTIVCFILAGKLGIHVPNGESIDADCGVCEHEPWTHQVENIDPTDVHAVIFDRKP